MHLVSISKFPFPCARSKKPCTGSKKEGATVQKTSSPMWAPITTEFPPTLWRQGSRSRCTGPKNRNRGQKQLIWLSNKISLGPAQIHAGPRKISSQVPENTQARHPTFFVPPGPKKNPARSKRHVRVQKTKNMHPDLLRTLQAERKNAERVQPPEQRNKQH